MSQLTLNIGKLKSDLQVLLEAKALPAILNLAKPKIQKRVADAYADYFTTTELYHDFSITGKSDRNVRAILGLDERDIDPFFDNLQDAIRATTEVVQLTSFGEGGFVKFGTGSAILFSIRTPNLPKHLLGQGFGSYISENGHLVPWLEWLLHGSGTGTHGVLFLKNFSERSKSGEAVMSDHNLLPFDIDDYNRFTSAFEQGDNEKNFLTEMAQNPNFRETANQIITEEISRASNNINLII